MTARQFFARIQNLYSLTHFTPYSLAFIMEMEMTLHKLCCIDYPINDARDVLKLIDRTFRNFYNFKVQGFFNHQEFENNGIIQRVRSLNPQYLKLKLYPENPEDSSGFDFEFEIEHLNNFIFLLLIKNIVEVLQDPNLDDELRGELETWNVKLQNRISAGLRSSLSMNRLQFIERIYMGFDTEYQTIEMTKNKLLCCTMCYYPQTLLKIRDLKISYSIKNIADIQDTKKPCISEELYLLIHYIRNLTGKNDIILGQLIEKLKNDSEVEEIITDGSIYFKKTGGKSLEKPNEFDKEFYDLRKSSDYSLWETIET